MKTFKDISFDSEKWAAQEKMFHRFCFKIAVIDGTNGISKTISEFEFI